MELCGTWCKSPSLVELAQALAQAQAELKNPPKDRINPHYKSKYADLATIRDTVLPVLNKHGLSVVQLPCELPGSGNTPSRVGLWTLLLHKSGEYLGACVPLRLVKDDPQGMGSALTYARRYALQAIAGVAGEDDDDGESANAAENQPAPRSQITAMIGYFRPLGLTPEDLARRVGAADVFAITPQQLEQLRTLARRIAQGDSVQAHFPFKEKSKHASRNAAG